MAINLPFSVSPVVNVADFALHVLLINQNRAVRECGLHFGRLDPMRPDLSQIVTVPVEHDTSIVYATHDNVAASG